MECLGASKVYSKTQDVWLSAPGTTCCPGRGIRWWLWKRVFCQSLTNTPASQRTYLHHGLIVQVLTDDGGSSQARDSNLGGHCVHWLHRMKSRFDSSGFWSHHRENWWFCSDLDSGSVFGSVICTSSKGFRELPLLETIAAISFSNLLVRSLTGPEACYPAWPP